MTREKGDGLSLFVIIAASVVFGIVGTMLIVCLAGDQQPPAIEQVSMRRGELPVGQPVMLYWVEADGRVTAESAVRTDFAGVLPYSLTTSKVAYFQFEGWTSWAPLSEIIAEP